MKSHKRTFNDVVVEVVRKRVKHVNFTVYPPDGRVRVSAPLLLDDGALDEVIRSRLSWIKRQQARLAHQVRPPMLAYVSGESHDYLGKSYRLRLIEHQGRPRVELRTHTIDLHIRKGSDSAACERVLIAWYRGRLKALIPPVIARWEPVIGVKVAAWGVKRMKTRWGSCSIQARRIWLNLDLAKRPPSSLEYIIVHEMVHLLERGHNKRFYAYMDRFYPAWREARAALNAFPPGDPARDA